MYQDKFKNSQLLTSHTLGDRRGFSGGSPRADQRHRPGGTAMSNALSAAFGTTHHVKSGVLSRSQNLASYMAHFKLSLIEMAGRLETSVDRLELLLSGKEPVNDGVAMYYEEVLGLAPGWLDRGGNLAEHVFVSKDDGDSLAESAPSEITVKRYVPPAQESAKALSLAASLGAALAASEDDVPSEGVAEPTALEPVFSDAPAQGEAVPEVKLSSGAETQVASLSESKLMVRAHNLQALCSSAEMRRVLERLSGRKTELFENFLAGRTFIADDVVDAFCQKLGFSDGWFDSIQDAISIAQQQRRIFNSEGALTPLYANVLPRRGRPSNAYLAALKNATTTNSSVKDTNLEDPMGTSTMTAPSDATTALAQSPATIGDLMKVGDLIGQSASLASTSSQSVISPSSTAPAPAVDAPVPKRRGRPLGSKTKPKNLELALAEAPKPARGRGRPRKNSDAAVGAIFNAAQSASAREASPALASHPIAFDSAPVPSKIAEVVAQPVAIPTAAKDRPALSLQADGGHLASALAKTATAVVPQLVAFPEPSVAASPLVGLPQTHKSIDQRVSFMLKAPEMEHRPLAYVAARDFAQKIEMMSENTALKLLTVLAGL